MGHLLLHLFEASSSRWKWLLLVPILAIVLIEL